MEHLFSLNIFGIYQSLAPKPLVEQRIVVVHDDVYTRMNTVNDTAMFHLNGQTIHVKSSDRTLSIE